MVEVGLCTLWPLATMLRCLVFPCSLCGRKGEVAGSLPSKENTNGLPFPEGSVPREPSFGDHQMFQMHICTGGSQSHWGLEAAKLAFLTYYK